MAKEVIKYPRFLSSVPTGEDNLEGESQNKVAEVISNLIKEDKLEKKVIGLDGEWGSGKSNLIEIIKKKVGVNYYTYVFDAWGNQEDLTRRTFLEEIIDKLFEEGFLTDSNKWNKKKNELLSKKSHRTKRLFPKIKAYWIFIGIALFLFTFLSSFYENILINKDWIPTWNASNWKPFIAIYVLPLIFITVGIVLASIEYCSERKKNKEKKPIDKESRLQTLSKIFYWLNGENIETEEKENIIENEPTVRQFREYFKLIQDDLGSKGKGLIIVFDNIDRLERVKIKGLWSSIHTFFAEYSYDKTWVIVPYYKDKLKECFDDDNQNGFIEKTFSINFRVSPPVVSAWDKLLKEKLIDAFGTEIISSEELSYVIELFDRFTEGNTIKPRQIINYINELVALYLLWKKSLDSGEMRFRYLSLFILTKDEILKNPIEIILQRTYLKGSSSLFLNDDDLDENISALTFNVKKELANEVLLKRELMQSIRNGNIELINKSKNHKAFIKYFKDAYDSIDFATKKNYISSIIKAISDVLTVENIKNYWENFAIDMLSSTTIVQLFEEFDEDHKLLLINVSNNTKKLLIKKLISSNSKELITEEQQNKYFKIIKEIRNYLSENDIDIDLSEFYDDFVFEPEPFLNVIKSEKEKYKDFKIEVEEESLKGYFYDDEIVNTDRVYNNIDLIFILKDNYNLGEISENIVDNLKLVTYSQNELIQKSLKILKKVNEKYISIDLSNSFYSTFLKENIDESIFIDCMAISVSNFNVSSTYPNFINTLTNLSENDVDELSKNIEWYMSFYNLLELILTNPKASNIDVLKQVAYDLTINSYGSSRINIDWCLENFSEICTVVFDDDESKIEEFTTRIDDCNIYYKSENFENIEISFFNNLKRKELKLVKKVSTDAVNYINQLSKEDIIEAFKEKNKAFSILKSIINNNLMSSFNQVFYTAFDDYLVDVLNGVTEIPEGEFMVSNLPMRLDGRKLKGVYTRIRDKVLENPQEVGNDIIGFFIDGLIKHGNLQNEPEKVTYKLIDFLFENSISINTIFVNNIDFFIDCILNSGEYIDDAKTKISAEFGEIENVNVKDKLIEKLNLSF